VTKAKNKIKIKKTKLKTIIMLHFNKLSLPLFENRSNLNNNVHLCQNKNNNNTLHLRKYHKNILKLIRMRKKKRIFVIRTAIKFSLGMVFKIIRLCYH